MLAVHICSGLCLYVLPGAQNIKRVCVCIRLFIKDITCQPADVARAAKNNSVLTWENAFDVLLHRAGSFLRLHL